MSRLELTVRIAVAVGCYAFAIWCAFEAAWLGCIGFALLAVGAVIMTMLEVGRR